MNLISPIEYAERVDVYSYNGELYILENGYFINFFKDNDGMIQYNNLNAFMYLQIIDVESDGNTILEIDTEFSSNSCVTLKQHYFNPTEADRLYDYCKNKLNWDRLEIRSDYKIQYDSLKTCHFGKMLNYTGLDIWDPELKKILDQLNNYFELDDMIKLNSVSCNYYENGRNSMDWHADDEDEFGVNPFIVSISLGCKRPLYVAPFEQYSNKHKQSTRIHPAAPFNGCRKLYRFWMEHGSLMTMYGNMQDDWVPIKNPPAGQYFYRCNCDCLLLSRNISTQVSCPRRRCGLTLKLHSQFLRNVPNNPKRPNDMSLEKGNREILKPDSPTMMLLGTIKDVQSTDRTRSQTSMKARSQSSKNLNDIQVNFDDISDGSFDRVDGANILNKRIVIRCGRCSLQFYIEELAYDTGIRCPHCLTDTSVGPVYARRKWIMLLCLSFIIFVLLCVPSLISLIWPSVFSYVEIVSIGPLCIVLAMLTKALFYSFMPISKVVSKSLYDM